jgi:pimeloyl-ACP methyl ester carboxylesterase
MVGKADVASVYRRCVAAAAQGLPGLTVSYDQDMTMHTPSLVSASRLAARADTTLDMVLLHGIYGRGRNWQAVARAIVEARADVACWLVDLPHHGGSGPGRHGETVLGLALDVIDWARAAGVSPRAVLGHSYGGKVGLAIAGQMRATPLQVWVVDSTPDVKPPSGSAWDMLRVVRSLPDRFPSRAVAQDAIRAAGYELPVAQWMTTNLARDGDTFRWQLDFDVMERLLHDFFVTAVWDVIESPDPSHEIHIVKASRSSVIAPDTQARIRAASGPHVQLHERDGGHWIHAERPDLIAQLVLEYLPVQSRQ